MQIFVLSFSYCRVNLSIMWGNTLETSYTNDAIVTSFVNGKNQFQAELKDTQYRSHTNVLIVKKTFLQKYHLKICLRMHTGEKTYLGRDHINVAM